MNHKLSVPIGLAVLLAITPILRAQDAKAGAENMKYSRDAFSKVHMVAIAKLTFDAPPAAEFRYDRYPNGGPERIQSGEGKEFARKDGKTWLASTDWGETGQPVDAATSKRLSNWISVIDSQLNYDAPLKFVKRQDAGARDEFVFEEISKSKGGLRRFVFDKYKNAKDDSPPILSHFTGPMQLGMHEAKVDIKFSYLISVKINDVTEKSPGPTSTASAAPAAQAPPTSTATVNPEPAAKSESKSSNNGELIDRGIDKGRKGELKGALADFDKAIKLEPNDSASDFKREADDPKELKTLAKFAHEGAGGAWGTILRGTHGLTPDELDGYLKKRVAEYTKGFSWVPKDSHLQWLKKEIVTINGWKWADWSFVPMLKGKKDYRNNPVYTRNLTTSYKGQLLEINFTTNLTTDPALKDVIDKIMGSVHLEE